MASVVTAQKRLEHIESILQNVTSEVTTAQTPSSTVDSTGRGSGTSQGGGVGTSNSGADAAPASTLEILGESRGVGRRRADLERLGGCAG